MALVLRQPKRVYPKMPKCLPLIDQYPLYALKFDGVDDRVDLPHVLTGIGTKITISAWICPAAYQDYWTIFEHRAGERDVAFGLGTDRKMHFFTFYFDGSYEDLVGAKEITLNKWWHVAAVHDGSAKRIYVNGVQDAVDATVKDLDFDSNYYAETIGAHRVTDAYGANGEIDEVCIYNRALSQAEIQYNMYNPLSPIRDGLVLFLPMIEGVGTSVKDFSGFGNNGTLYGGVGWVELAKYEIPAGQLAYD